jgi:hypothetical protein
MKKFLLCLAAAFVLGAPAESYAKQPAEITWHAAETEPETAEENAAHADGRAVDINEVNKMPVSFAVDPAAPEDKREKVRELLRSMETWARGNPVVEVFISPIGGFHRDIKTRQISREATQEEVAAHWDHIHMATVK